MHALQGQEKLKDLDLSGVQKVKVWGTKSSGVKSVLTILYFSKLQQAYIHFWKEKAKVTPVIVQLS